MPPKASQAVPTRTSTRLAGKRRHELTPSPQKRRPKRRKQAQKSAPPDQDPEDLNYDKIEDSSLVTRPVAKHVHPSLSNAWVVQPLNPMWFIFDGPTPARQFKRGVPLDETKEYPVYSKPPYEDLTESEPEEGHLMPFAPAAHTYVCSPSHARRAHTIQPRLSAEVQPHTRPVHVLDTGRAA